MPIAGLAIASFRIPSPMLTVSFPIKLGQLIASRGGPDGLPCSLSDVRIYSGRPDPNRDKRSHAAHMRQSNR